jgi:septum formation protein
MSLILASTSRIRQLILRNAGLKFEAMAPAVDEHQLKQELGTLSPVQLASSLAGHKALSLSRPQDVVIGADQTLSFHGQCIGKARNIAEAKLHLQNLRGQTHSLHSAIAIAFQGQIQWTYSETAHLTMRKFSDTFLETYLAANANEILPCVGAYQLESHGVQLFERIEGDYFTILGLPLLPLLAYLRQENYLTS